MPVALNDEQLALAQSVTSFAERHDSRGCVRKDTVEHQLGILPALWSELVDLGLNAVHLSEAVGGQGGDMGDLAVVIGEAGRALLPGPLLPTVCASAIVSDASPQVTVSEVLKRLAAGATAAVILPQPTVTAADRHGRVRLDGTVATVLGAASADLLVVGARADSGTDLNNLRWFVVEKGTAGVEVTAEEGVDLARDVASVRFRDADVTEAARLFSIDADRAADLTVALMAVEAAGVIAWCSDAATAFVKSRIQFGRPVGAFQAVQHRVAQLRITSELATASAWDAVRGLSENATQRTHAVAAAAIMSVGRAVHAAVECLCLHGAIGFTWEHDLHLYWRRAIALAALARPVESWEARLGEIAIEGPRDFSLTLPETEPAFRNEVGDILDQAAELSNPYRSLMGDGDAVATGPRRTLLADHGLVAPALPSPHGMDAGPLQQLIIQEEFDRRGLQEPTMAIAQWLLPIVLNHGTPEQVKALAGPTLRGELVWCQLFSEPDAGSDVASLTLRATQVEGGWTLRGQKIWTTHAHLADMGLCLARTGTEDSKHRGLTIFLIDMADPHLEVRRIKQANGDAEFNEVFFNDLFVPDSMMLGQPGQGWALTIETLAQERLFIGTYRDTGNEQRIRQIILNKQYAGSREDAVRALGRISARGAAIAAMNVRETLRRLQGYSPGPATSIGKAAASMLHVDAAAAALNLIGPAGLLSEKHCEPVFHELDIPTWVIGGGTLEIQLNTIASFVLELPRR